MIGGSTGGTDRTARRLAFGTAAGSLRVSDGGGEARRTVSEHLPPVSAVRFER